jgi:hypothetical protein
MAYLEWMLKDQDFDLVIDRDNPVADASCLRAQATSAAKPPFLCVSASAF